MVCPAFYCAVFLCYKNYIYCLCAILVYFWRFLKIFSLFLKKDTKKTCLVLLFIRIFVITTKIRVKQSFGNEK